MAADDTDGQVIISRLCSRYKRSSANCSDAAASNSRRRTTAELLSQHAPLSLGYRCCIRRERTAKMRLSHHRTHHAAAYIGEGGGAIKFLSFYSGYTIRQHIKIHDEISKAREIDIYIYTIEREERSTGIGMRPGTPSPSWVSGAEGQRHTAAT